jgi:hypothetical protein
MKAIVFTTVPIVLALAGVPAGAWPELYNTRLLNLAGVQELIARGERADHARLADHFFALAGEYDREARRHDAMSIAFSRNSNRRVVVESSPHCAWLASLGEESAAIVRELAAHHVRLAAGAPPATTHDLPQFQRQAPAPLPALEDLMRRAARARSPSDHWQLEQYFRELAARYADGADEHAAIAAAYRAGAGRADLEPALRCDRLAVRWRDAAREAAAIAAVHQALAGLS